MREGILDAGVHHTGRWMWRNAHTGEETLSVNYEVNTREMILPWVRLYYTFPAAQVDIDYRVRLQTTSPRFGGLRWWFVCDLSINGAVSAHATCSKQLSQTRRSKRYEAMCNCPDPANVLRDLHIAIGSLHDEIKVLRQANHRTMTTTHGKESVILLVSDLRYIHR